jgi:hypothetical protein
MVKTSITRRQDALGITWEADPVRHDDRYYWNGELDNPKALEDVDAVDEDGNPVWVKEYDAVTESMVDTTCSDWLLKVLSLI